MRGRGVVSDADLAVLRAELERYPSGVTRQWLAGILRGDRHARDVIAASVERADLPIIHTTDERGKTTYRVARDINEVNHEAEYLTSYASSLERRRRGLLNAWQNGSKPKQPQVLTDTQRDADEMEDGLREAPVPTIALRRLARDDKAAAIELERVAHAARWNLAQKTEAAQSILHDRAGALNALTETFERLGGLQYPYRYFRKALQAGSTPEASDSDAAPSTSDASIESMYDAVLEGNPEAIDDITRH